LESYPSQEVKIQEYVSEGSSLSLLQEVGI
jgi:hypothetical protein